jgi:mxaK protein
MRRWSIILAWILVIGFSLLVLDNMRKLSQRLTYNNALEDPQQLADQTELTPELTLIRAWHLQQQGNNQQALALYHSITQSANNDIAKTNQQIIHETALYNIGVINLNQAAKHWNKMGVWAYAEVIAPLNQAKQVFKKVLGNNPQHWNAQYNLDYALRITPPPKQKEKEGMRESRSSVHAIMPGQPAGGP